MIHYDKKAGTHFIGKRVRASSHAIEEAVRDFRLPEDEAERWIIDNLVKAQFIGMVYGENNRLVRLFGYKRIAFILATDAELVITVYQRDLVDSRLREPLEQIVKSAVKTANEQLHRTETEHNRSIAFLKSILSGADETEIDGDSIRAEIARHEYALKQARQDHARLLKGVVAYV